MWQPELEPEAIEASQQTKQQGIDLVKAVFASMGGTVVPPVRPKKITPRWHNSMIDSFMMDFENACLADHWDSSAADHPKGDRRHLNKEWAAMIQSQVYPHHSDIDWIDYVQYVIHGGGDEWFHEEINEQGREITANLR